DAVGPPCRQGDGRARLGAGERRGLADARRRAGDRDDLSTEIEGHATHRKSPGCPADDRTDMPDRPGRIPCLARRLAPFGGAALLAFLLVIPEADLRWGEYAASAAVTVAVVLGGVLLPWRRWPGGAPSPPPCCSS